MIVSEQKITRKTTFMARPRKNNAEYFSHDNTMRNDTKIKAVRAKFGLDGYAIWNMFLESLTEAENFELLLDELDMELFAGDYGINPEQLIEILNYFVHIRLLSVSVTETPGKKKYWSQGLKKRLQNVVDKRGREREKADNRDRNDHGKFVSAAETDISVAETPQKKVKEKKVKEKKVKEKKEDIYITLSEQVEPHQNSYAPNLIEKFLLYWDETDQKNTPRWKKEKTWDIKKRLERWKKQNEEWAYERSQRQQLKKVDEIPTQENTKTERIDTGFQKINFNNFN